MTVQYCMHLMPYTLMCVLICVGVCVLICVCMLDVLYNHIIKAPPIRFPSKAVHVQCSTLFSVCVCIVRSIYSLMSLLSGK